MTEKTKSQYLEYLPAIHHQDSFLGRFLLPFETVLTGLEGLLSTIDRYFAPALTDPEFLPWLATWVTLVLDEEWPEAKRRRLIGEAVKLYQERGTVRGLKRYLKIYTGLEPEIREWRWPGGMQIGVSSQIGGDPNDDDPFLPPDSAAYPIEISNIRFTEADPVDYYVVTVNQAGEVSQWYYRAEAVRQVEFGDTSITIHLHKGDSKLHVNAQIARRDGLTDQRYEFDLIDQHDTEKAVTYRGDTRLIGEATVEQPYCFIVDVRVPLAEVTQVKIDKVRAIVNLEKPAHTIYYLKLTPVIGEYVLQPMQLDLRSTIGVDSIIG